MNQRTEAIDALVFSRNRPLQLHCLLASIKRLTNLSDVSVLHRYDHKYKPGLEKLKALHADIRFMDETDFAGQVRHYLKRGPEFCLFFVDDIVVKDRIDLNLPCQALRAHPELLTFSLRLGTHLTSCYMARSRQSVPDGRVSAGMFVWDWRGAEHDWGYPFSVDGHVFRRKELETWTSDLRFANPNQFEAQMQTIPTRFAVPTNCACYLVSKVLNMPLNMVQNEFNNRCEQGSVDELYETWMSGKALDYSRIIGFANGAVHQRLFLPLVDV